MISPRNELEFVVRCRATKHPARICAVLQVGAAPAPRRVAGSLNRTSAIRLASEGGEAKAGAFAYAPCERQLKVLTLNYLDFCLKNCIQYC
jgi:hypothetical protein